MTRIIAFYLPQFHRIPENDAWWGEGFTEWTNTRRARPQYVGHYQPREPQDDRYYDLLDPSTVLWQTELASRYGVDAFCYYHYWFKGKLLLERPLQERLRNPAPSHPFCMAWANEPWTRTWDGGEKHVLMAQDYGDRDDWAQHYAYVSAAFKDPRYIRVNDKPLFLVYRPKTVSRLREMFELWQALARRDGFPGLHLANMLNSFDAQAYEGFDCAVEFEPMQTIGHFMGRSFAYKLSAQRRIREALPAWAGRRALWHEAAGYEDLWRRILERPITPAAYPGAFVGWDNTARRPGRGMIVSRPTPETFGRFLTAQLRRARACGSPFLFLNAWNEWAEGTYLEPDQRYGTGMLEAVARACADA